MVGIWFALLNCKTHREMVVQFVMQITFLLLLTYRSLAEAAPSMAKPNCESRCGNLEIPYPFGIGPDCYMDKSFEIVCNGSGAFLTSIDTEVQQVNIGSYPSDPYNSHFDSPTVQVQIPIIFNGRCSTNSPEVKDVGTSQEVLFPSLRLIIHSFRLVATTLQR